MHIHSGPQSNQSVSLGLTQAAQQAMAAKREAAVVRRKLSGFAAIDEEETTYRVETRGDADPDRRQKPQQDDEESFRSIFVSVSA